MSSSGAYLFVTYSLERVTVGGRTSAYVQQVQKLSKIAAKRTTTEEATIEDDSDLTPLSDAETMKKGSRKRKVSQRVLQH